VAENQESNKMIENTSKRDPMMNLLGAMAEGTSNYITGMEAQGQRQLINSAQLPVKGSTDPILAAMRITFGETVQGDPLFRSATLPEGWKKQGSDHAMWSYIVDDKGRRRAGIFYKAAFYDRDAHIGARRRFEINRGDYNDEANIYHVINDGGREVFRTGIKKIETYNENRENYYTTLGVVEKEQHAACLAWLDEHHPEHKDVDTGWSKIDG